MTSLALAEIPRDRVASRRRLLVMFAPLLLLVGAALATNAGGGVASDAGAATVNVTASVASEKHLATNICTGGSSGETSGPSAGAGGTIAFGAMTMNTSYTRSCTVGFGSTNSGTVAMQVNAASATLGWTAPFAAQGACSALVATNARVGIDAAAALGATTNAAIDCATGGQYQSIPTSATTACSVTGQATDANCVLTVAVTTGAATPASVSNSSLTVNAA